MTRFPVPFSKVEHRIGPSARDSKGQARQRLKRALRIQARQRVNSALHALLQGCDGPFRTELCAAILAIGADLHATHVGPAECCSALGLHAGRVGDQLPFMGKRKAAEAAFSARAPIAEQHCVRVSA